MIYARKCDIQKGNEALRVWLPEDLAVIGNTVLGDWEVIRTFDYALASQIDVERVEKAKVK